MRSISIRYVGGAGGVGGLAEQLRDFRKTANAAEQRVDAGAVLLLGF